METLKLKQIEQMSVLPVLPYYFLNVADNIFNCCTDIYGAAAPMRELPLTLFLLKIR